MRDPELKYTQSNLAYCKFTLAVNRKYSKNGEKQVDFINCVAWRKTAENLAGYMSKGSKIAVEGNIQTVSYTNKNGAKVYTTEVVAENIEFLDSVKEQEQNNQGGYRNQTNNYNQDEEISPNNFLSDDDMPF